MKAGEAVTIKQCVECLEEYRPPNMMSISYHVHNKVESSVDYRLADTGRKYVCLSIGEIDIYFNDLQFLRDVLNTLALQGIAAVTAWEKHEAAH
jgi:hypothetical protein